MNSLTKEDIIEGLEQAQYASFDRYYPLHYKVSEYLNTNKNEKIINFITSDIERESGFLHFDIDFSKIIKYIETGEGDVKLVVDSLTFLDEIGCFLSCMDGGQPYVKLHDYTFGGVAKWILLAS